MVELVKVALMGREPLWVLHDELEVQFSMRVDVRLFSSGGIFQARASGEPSFL